MGTRGPMPLRSENRVGHGNGAAHQPSKVGPEDFSRVEGVDLRPEQPPAEEHWHPAAKMFWEALGRTPEKIWMTPGGWAVAHLQAEQISREMKPQPIGVHPETGEPVFAVVPMKGGSLASHMKMWGALGLLEGDRRRMGIEITLHPRSGPEAVADVVSLDQGRAAALAGE